MIHHEGVDVRRGPCVNSAGSNPATASQVRPAHDDAADTKMLTAEDIARLTGSPLRTARARLSRWASQPGSPVVRLPRAGVGRRPWAVPLDAYCASRGMDPADVLEALSPSAQAA